MCTGRSKNKNPTCAWSKKHLQLQNVVYQSRKIYRNRNMRDMKNKKYQNQKHDIKDTCIFMSVSSTTTIYLGQL